MLDVLVVRIGMLVQQLARHEDESGRAEAALEGAGLDERFLDRVELFIVFDSRHLRAFDEAGDIKAARYRASVDQHGAAAAQALAAAFARADEAELVAQHFHQGLVRRHLRRHGLAVQREANLPPHLCKAMKTASGFKGSEVMRTPTASCTAFAIAGETANVAVSPTPFAPKGPVRCSATTASLTMLAGRSSRPGILYSASDALRSCPSPSNSIFSKSVKPSCMIAPPESCVSTIFGLIGVPTSATLTSRVTRTRPVSVSTPVAPTIQKGVAFSVCPFASGGVYGGMKLPAPVTEPARMPYFFRNTSAVAASAGKPSSAFNSFSFLSASSAASFTALPLWKSDREPSVAMSNGVTSVSECTIVTASVGICKTSAAIWASAVSEPWPMSTQLV